MMRTTIKAKAVVFHYCNQILTVTVINDDGESLNEQANYWVANVALFDATGKQHTYALIDGDTIRIKNMDVQIDQYFKKNGWQSIILTIKERK